MAGTETGGSKDGLPEWLEKPKWFYRRCIIFGTLSLDALILIACVTGWFFNKPESQVMSVIAGGVIARSTAVIGSYVFQASWEDVSLTRIGMGMRGIIGKVGTGRTGI